MIPTILQWILLASGLAASLFLFLSLKKEILGNSRRSQKQVEEMAERLRKTEEPDLFKEPDLFEQSVPPGLSNGLRSGFNLNRRVQATRLLRRGEDVAHVAAALGVPRREVELLIRVQQMAAAGVASVERRSGSFVSSLDTPSTGSVLTSAASRAALRHTVTAGRAALERLAASSTASDDITAVQK